jgi:PPM family protein phosphatase
VSEEGDVNVGVRSDRGLVRDHNEDAWVAVPPLFVVADGMGGHSAGEVASKIAVTSIADGADGFAAMDAARLVDLVQAANSAVWRTAKTRPELRGMGTTCTLLVLGGGMAQLAHVGDSRAYLLHRDALSQLTQDHSIVGRMVAEGRITEEEAARHPARSTITRALGAAADVQVDVVSVPIEVGDRFLLCTDGLSGSVSRDAIHDVLAGTPVAQDAADRLIAIANGAGGEDNVTAIVVDVGGPNMGGPAGMSGDGASPAAPVQP